VSAQTDYTVTIHGLGGTATDTIRIATVSNPPVLAYAQPAYSFLMGSTIEPLRPTNTGGPIIAWAIRPAANGKTIGANTGLQFNSTTGRITGTPIYFTPPTDYIIVATALGGAQDSAVVSIATTTPAPVLSYPDTNIVWTVGIAISPLRRTQVTGTVLSYSIAPSLPSGLTLNPTTGVIFGTPVAAVTATSYVISAYGPGGVGSDSVTITTAANPPLLSFAQPAYAFTTGIAIEALRPTNTGGPIIGWAIGMGSNGRSLTQNTGLLFNVTTGRITGTPVYLSTARHYTVTALGLSGVSDTETVEISTVSPAGKLAVGESSAFSFGWTGISGYTLRVPAVDELTTSITVSILGTSGRTIWSARLDPNTAGRTLMWDGRDVTGRRVSAGVYLVRIVAQGAGTKAVYVGKGVTHQPR
jgi:hypothetical protein